MNRRHRILAMAAGLSLLGSTAIAATTTIEEVQPAASSPALLASLATADPSDRLGVIVHGTSFDATADALADAGLRRLVDLPRIDAAIVKATPAQLDALAIAGGITYLEGDDQLTAFGETSHDATNGRRLQNGYDVVLDSSHPSQGGGNANGHDQGNGAGQGHGNAGTTETLRLEATGKGVSIAVIDSGVDGTHPLFLNDPDDPESGSRVVVNKKFVYPCVLNFLGENGLPCSYDDPIGHQEAVYDTIGVDVPGNDSDTISAGGHGTHVAGTAAGGRYSDGVVYGAAPESTVISLSAGATLSITAAVQAQYWVLDNHENPCELPGGADDTCPAIRVVNNSYGSAGDYDARSATAKIQTQLAEEGVVMVWAAGNDGGDGTENLANPPGQSPVPGVLMVANYDDAGVGLRDGSLAGSSSRGLASDMGTWPDVSAPGTDITSACRPWLAICGPTTTDLGTISGTSMATPHVAGIVAQLFELVPSATPAQIENVLEDTAHQFAFGGRYFTDFRNADHTSSFDKGHGLVDAVAAANELRAGIVADPVGELDPSCAAIVIDPAGDEFYAPVKLAGEPSDARLDLRDVTIVEAAGSFDLVIGMGDVGGLPPGTNGYDVVFEAEVAGTDPSATLSITASLRSAGATFEATSGSAGDETTIELDGSFDADADRVVVTVPDGIVATDATLTAIVVDVVAVYSPGVTVYANDDSDAACDYRFGVGAIDPSEGPADRPNDSGHDVDGEPIVDDGTDVEPLKDAPDYAVGTFRLAAGDADGAEGTVDVAPATEHVCNGPKDPVCHTYWVQVTESGTLTFSVAADVYEDFDLYLYDEAGGQLAGGGFLGTTDEFETFAHPVMRGVYQLTVAPYLVTGEVDYAVSVSLD